MTPDSLPHVHLKLTHKDFFPLSISSPFDDQVPVVYRTHKM